MMRDARSMMSSRSLSRSSSWETVWTTSSSSRIFSGEDSGDIRSRALRAERARPGHLAAAGRLPDPPGKRRYGEQQLLEVARAHEQDLGVRRDDRDGGA